MRTTLKLLLIAGALLLEWAQIAARIESLLAPTVQWFGLAAYAGLLGICLAGLIAAAFIPLAALRWLFAAGLALAGIMVGTYEYTVDDQMPYDAFISMINASGSLHEAWGQYAGAMVLGGVQALLLLLGIGLRAGRHRPGQGSGRGQAQDNRTPTRRRLPAWLARAPARGSRHRPALVAAPLLALAVMVAVLFARGGEGGRGLPASYTGAAYSLLYGYERATAVIEPRQPVRLVPAAPPNGDGDIVLLVDESISGHYLDINNPAGVRSGLLQPAAGVAVHNFGLAVSIAHCSAAVNYTLRHGGTRDDYQRINGTMPSLWAYAKAAGMETVYIDVPRTRRIFNNLMNDSELVDIDQWIEFDDVPIQRRDHAAATALAGYLNDGRRQFIYLNKIGAHFPIHDKYPDAYMRYRPVLPRGQYLHIGDTGDRDGFSGSRESWVLYRNAYRNTLLWNVGGFFDRLLGAADLAGATILYTSDHGQNLHERGGTGVVTHCSPDPQPEEGLVPLVVLTGAAPAPASPAAPTAPARTPAIDWTAAAATGRNRSSHFQIFPTMLELMGYDPAAVTALYGSDLRSANPAPFAFNYRFNARLGRAPGWRQIDLARIAYPPASDFAAPASSASGTK
ncbi:sulfatase-like hydrolase/transferase [Parasphingorhabdus sp.]|uniref:sulfatase-like hydrolase/transferase n=1 Tax=Parasphingorhabdus sp. TaxID=2709688 RepID=UPI00300312A8